MTLFPRIAVLCVFSFCAVLATGAPASAVPYFAHEYGLSCQKCHTEIPRLNAFGQAFMDHGFFIPGATPQRPFALSAKINLAYSSAPDPNGLPKAIVDEVEVFLAGKTSARTNYFVEQYLVDGGNAGATRDAWFANRFTPDGARVPVYVQGGAFTLPLPIDPESFRETVQHYTVWDQTVGNNSFNFFESKIGVQGRAGFDDHGLSVHLVAVQGHDKQSGLPALGIDTMAYAQGVYGPLTASFYRYGGSRPIDGYVDRFWRQGYGLVYARGRLEIDNVFQTGHDTAIDVFGTPAYSSGGFTQARFDITSRLFALARYEGTYDPVSKLARDGLALIGYRVSHNSRFTVENVLSHTPQTFNTLNAQYTVAY